MIKNYRKKLLVFIVGLLTSTHSFGQVFGFEFIQKRDKLVIPFEIYNNLIVVPVTLNDQIPLKFILDTGIRTAILTDKLITDVLNVSYNRKIVVKGPGDGRTVEAYVANNVTLKLPGVIGRGQALLVLQEDYLQLSSHLGTEVHGILGYELFSRFIVEINYKGSYLALYKRYAFKPKRSYTEIPINLIDTKPYLRTSIQFKDGKKIDGKLLIDTGASHALLLESQEDNRVEVPINNLRANLGRGLGGIIKGRVGRIDNISFGGFKFDDVITSFPDPNSYMDSMVIDRDGTIGGEIFRRFRMVFDYSSETLYMKKFNNRYKEDFHYNMSGLEIIAKGDELHKFVIEGVMNDSPAELVGIKPGDVIKVINGHSAENIKLNYINSLLNSKEGKRIKLIIKRGEKEIRKGFKLKSMI